MNKVVTVTLNPAIDLTIELDRLVPGTVHRARAQHAQAGGKGVCVAAVLRALDVPVVATGWLGRDNAAVFEAEFARRGVGDRMLRLPGSTRTNIKLSVAERGDSTDINLPGLTLEAADAETALAALAQRLQTLLGPGDWCELAGSLPPGLAAATWLPVAQVARARGAWLAIDTGGAVLGELLDALGGAGGAPRALPALIKPNRDELEELLGRPVATRLDVADAASALQARGVARVMVSLGADGAVLVSAQGRWHAAALPVPVATTVGAGDAMVAGTLAALIEGRPWPAAGVFGMACAAARVQQIAPELPARAQIEQLATRITPLPL
jgi:1-phosphofructokinase